jgi:hypothetical protein
MSVKGTLEMENMFCVDFQCGSSVLKEPETTLEAANDYT